MSKIAQRFLSAPSSTIDSERLNSAGLIYTKKRNNITGDRAEKILFLKANMTWNVRCVLIYLCFVLWLHWQCLLNKKLQEKFWLTIGYWVFTIAIGYWVLGFRIFTIAIGYWVLGFRILTIAIGYWVLGFRIFTIAIGYWVLGFVHYWVLLHVYTLDIIFSSQDQRLFLCFSIIRSRQYLLMNKCRIFPRIFPLKKKYMYGLHMKKTM